MEAEVARHSQQSVELQGKLPPFPLLMLFCRTVPCCVLPAESLAHAQRERDDAMLQSAELKGKLESAENDARARADEAARSAKEEAEERKKAAAHRLGAVTNSLSGLPTLQLSPFALILRFSFVKSLVSFSTQGIWVLLRAIAAKLIPKTWRVLWLPWRVSVARQEVSCRRRKMRLRACTAACFPRRSLPPPSMNWRSCLAWMLPPLPTSVVSIRYVARRPPF